MLRRLSHRLLGTRRRLLLAALAVPLAGLGVVVGIDRVFFSPAPTTIRACPFEAPRSTRPALQRILDGVVSGPSAIAPGATAYVSGPHGTWTGAAGVSDSTSCAQMRVDARMRLESVTKIYTAALILRLEQEGRLRVGDTVERWLPGLLPYGSRITIRDLLTMSSGIVDNNDFTNASASQKRVYLNRVGDASLRARLLAAAAAVDEDPAAVMPATLWVRWAAWQPLLFTPGNGYHYSNIGYDVLGLIAARAGGEALPVLFRDRIFDPLQLAATAYDPQGPIDGPHAHGYGIEADGATYDTTDRHWGVAADGGIVSDAEDTGRFLTALMRGRLLDRQQVAAMRGEDLWLGGQATGCADQAYGWSGGGNGFKTEVWVAGDGSRVAVLLLNARHYDTAQPLADAEAHTAMAELYCAG